MRLEQWELELYQDAARDACTRLREHPDDLVAVADGSGMWVPRWMETAAEMHKLRVLQAAMADRGPWGPV